jgi:hypothetical protein
MKTLATEYTVRRLRAEDAEGVVDCVRRVYGDSYIIHTELYHPEEIVALNEVGRLVSVVALDDGGEIVGHYALERPDPVFASRNRERPWCCPSISIITCWRKCVSCWKRRPAGWA